ncbi:hypothetical protein OKW39_004861 [Paraburkholderia sp. MM6662-R1]
MHIANSDDRALQPLGDKCLTDVARPALHRSRDLFISVIGGRVADQRHLGGSDVVVWHKNSPESRTQHYARTKTRAKPPLTDASIGFAAVQKRVQRVAPKISNRMEPGMRQGFAGGAICTTSVRSVATRRTRRGLAQRRQQPRSSCSNSVCVQGVDSVTKASAQRRRVNGKRRQFTSAALCH